MTYRRAINTVGTFAARPTSAPEGTVYFCTDGPLQFIMSGGTWKSYLGSTPLVAPAAASTWSLINCTLASTFSDFKGGLLFNGSCTAGTMQVAKKTAPGTPYTITAHFIPSWGTNTSNSSSHNFCVAGICWRETSTGNLHLFGPVTATSVTGIYVNTFRLVTASGTGSSGITYTNSTDFNFTPLIHNLSSNGVWVRGVDNGTNRLVYYSGDGLNWNLFGSVTRTTSVTPNEVGIFAGNYATAPQTTTPITVFTSVEII